MKTNTIPPYANFEEEYRACPNKGYDFTQKHFERLREERPIDTIRPGDVLAAYHRKADEIMIYLAIETEVKGIKVYDERVDGEWNPENTPDSSAEYKDSYQDEFVDVWSPPLQVHAFTEEDFDNLHFNELIPFSPYRFPANQYELFLPGMSMYHTVSPSHSQSSTSYYVRSNMVVIDRLEDLEFIEYTRALHGAAVFNSTVPKKLHNWVGPQVISDASLRHWQTLARRLKVFTCHDEPYA